MRTIKLQYGWFFIIFFTTFAVDFGSTTILTKNIRYYD